MNNRRTAPGGQMTHMLSVILAKVTNIEKLLTPAIHNLPDSEILDSKGVRLLTKMSDRTLLRRRNDGSLPFHRDKVLSVKHLDLWGTNCFSRKNKIFRCNSLKIR